MVTKYFHSVKQDVTLFEFEKTDALESTFDLEEFKNIFPTWKENYVNFSHRINCFTDLFFCFFEYFHYSQDHMCIYSKDEIDTV